MIKVFKYLPKYDAFDVTPEYREVSRRLGLQEWTPVVWITRLFTLDNDYGEHMFDNWDERAQLEKEHEEKDLSHLLIVAPGRFQDGKDGPCNTDEFRKLFWTDVFKSFHLDLETIFEKARIENDQIKRELDEFGSSECYLKEYYIEDLEDRINIIKERHKKGILGVSYES